METSALTRYQAGLAVLDQTQAIHERLATGMLTALPSAGQTGLATPAGDSASFSNTALELLAAEEAADAQATGNDG